MLLFVWALFVARDIVIVLLLALVVSSALDPIVTFLERKKIPRILGALSIFILAIFILALIFYAIVPIALFEFNNLLTSISQGKDSIFSFIKAPEFLETVNSSLERLTDLLLGGSVSLVDIVSKFLGGLALLISVFVLSFYLTVDKNGVERFLTAILPAASEARTLEIYSKTKQKIGHWLKGQLFLSLTIGVAVFVGLKLLGVKYSLILAILAGTLELIPYVGPIFSGTVAVLIGLTESAALGIYVLLLFIAIQQLEGHVLVPAVTRFTTSLNPVVVLVSLMIGAKIFGFVGIILAVPLAVMAQEFLEEWSQSKQRRRDSKLIRE